MDINLFKSDECVALGGGGQHAGRFCHNNMLSHRALVRVTDIRQQLLRHVQRVGLVVSSAGKDATPVRRAMTAGFFANAAALAPHGRALHYLFTASHYLYFSLTLLARAEANKLV